jgi:hypothetical protein
LIDVIKLLQWKGYIFKPGLICLTSKI